jgi:5'-nucleotidase
MEATIGGVAGIAFSLHAPEDFQGVLDYAPAARIAHRIVSAISKNGLLPNLLLNVNIPYLSVDQIKGILVTRQGLRVYRDRLDRRIDPRGRPYYWIGGDSPTAIPDEGTDFGALEQGYVSVTPLHLDLTDFQALISLREINW